MLFYLLGDDEFDEWGWLRREEVLIFDLIVFLVKVVYERYGFKDFKLKGGVLEGEEEIKMICVLKKVFLNFRIMLDLNGVWFL